MFASPAGENTEKSRKVYRLALAEKTKRKRALEDRRQYFSCHVVFLSDYPIVIIISNSASTCKFPHRKIIRSPTVYRYDSRKNGLEGACLNDD